METVITPYSLGQICKIKTPLSYENADDVYVVTEDPTPFADEEEIYVVNLKDLQRNISQPLLAPKLGIPKNELTVIAADLDQYIKSWNHND